MEKKGTRERERKKIHFTNVNHVHESKLAKYIKQFHTLNCSKVFIKSGQCFASMKMLLMFDTMNNMLMIIAKINFIFKVKQ
mgnify:CR=1 FL=1